MILFGTDNNSTIGGVWFWRGQDLAFKVCEQHVCFALIRV
jgi:elongation factor 1-gamma